jgi:hypothetical protein
VRRATDDKKVDILDRRGRVPHIDDSYISSGTQPITDGQREGPDVTEQRLVHDQRTHQAAPFMDQRGRRPRVGAGRHLPVGTRAEAATH